MMHRGVYFDISEVKNLRKTFQKLFSEKRHRWKNRNNRDYHEMRWAHDYPIIQKFYFSILPLLLL